MNHLGDYDVIVIGVGCLNAGMARTNDDDVIIS